jgi:hypothetical protein
MRIRTIKPEFWTSEQVTAVDYRARLLFIGLLNQCDKHGCLECRPNLIRRNIFPFDDVTLTDISEDIQSLSNIGLIHLYSSTTAALQETYSSTTAALQETYSSTTAALQTEAAQKVKDAEFIFIPNFLKHQTPSTWEKNISASTLPLPLHYISTTVDLQQYYSMNSEKRIVKSDKREVRSEGRTPPLQESLPEPIQNFLDRFHAVHPECKKTSSLAFVSALRAQSALEVDPVVIDEALNAFTRQCCDLVTFRPQSPLGKFENYLRRQMEEFSKNHADDAPKKPQRLRV